ncbi:MAG: DUF262 domain-containing protein [Candidatus Ancillula trichonymphae]|jgi:uncharacterized protein with ParB-like and HNH nuclease domain|nr:DUF262 domain-containing protein [Candidatus Ancillula trichonymphae]
MEKEIEPKLIREIGEYLDIGSRRFVIPEYQRAYSWGTEQCEMLFSDVSNFGNGGVASDEYFFENVIVDCSGEDQLQLIDGQQRTT